MSRTLWRGEVQFFTVVSADTTPTIEQLHSVAQSLPLISFRRLVILELVFCSILRLVNQACSGNSHQIQEYSKWLPTWKLRSFQFRLMREGDYLSGTVANTADLTRSWETYSTRICKKLHKAVCVHSAAHKINRWKEIDENTIKIQRLLRSQQCNYQFSNSVLLNRTHSLMNSTTSLHPTYITSTLIISSVILLSSQLNSSLLLSQQKSATHFSFPHTC